MGRIEEPRFCVRCGGEMRKETPEGDLRERSVCSRCRHIHYLDPKIACGTIPERNGHVVLIRRKIDPRAGYWSFPCGFMEVDETTELAALRETEEETGLPVELTGFHGVYSYPQSWWGGAIVVVVYRARALGGEPRAGDDAAEARPFLPAEIDWSTLAFQSSTEALRDWFAWKGLPPGSSKK